MLGKAWNCSAENMSTVHVHAFPAHPREAALPQAIL
jgi:hypothetical protein